MHKFHARSLLRAAQGSSDPRRFGFRSKRRNSSRQFISRQFLYQARTFPRRLTPKRMVNATPTCTSARTIACS